ncbi:hypothetical protein MXB_5498 [Myxobolus squamalis]|nr:hypothetical protein MXB_5498 [Myxobolus squamalis]
MPSDLDVIIHTERWDLRTFHLLEIKENLNGIHLQRTCNSDLIIGSQLTHLDLINSIFHDDSDILQNWC